VLLFLFQSQYQTTAYERITKLNGSFATATDARGIPAKNSITDISYCRKSQLIQERIFAKGKKINPAIPVMNPKNIVEGIAASIMTFVTGLMRETDPKKPR